MEQLPNQSRTAALLPLIAFITVSIAWGTTYAAIKIVVDSIPPFLMAGVRFTFAGAVLMLVAKMMGVALPGWRDCARMGLVGIMLLGVANTLVGWAEMHLDSAFAALVVNASPFIFVGLMVATGDRVPAMGWWGMVIGFAGMVVLVWPELSGLLGGDAAALHSPNFWWAVVALLGASTSWAVGSWFAARNPVKSHHLMVIGVQKVAGGLFALIFSLASGEAARAGTPTMASIWGLIYLIVVGSWLGYVAYIYCVMHLPPQRTATTTYINNVVAIAVGWLFLGEVISGFMLVGGGIILFGVWIVNVAKQKAKAIDPVVPPVEQPAEA